MNEHQKTMFGLLQAYQAKFIDLEILERETLQIASKAFAEDLTPLEILEAVQERFEFIKRNPKAALDTDLSITSSGSLIMWFEEPDEGQLEERAVMLLEEAIDKVILEDNSLKTLLQVWKDAVKAKVRDFINDHSNDPYIEQFVDCQIDTLESDAKEEGISWTDTVMLEAYKEIGMEMGLFPDDGVK